MTEWWARAWPALLGAAVVLTVAAPAAVASYLHARTVVARHDEVMAPWLPLSVDGMLLAALVVMWVRRRRGVAVGAGPWAAFVFGITATLAANTAAVQVPSVEAYAVSLFPPVALAVALELVALVAGRAPARVVVDTAGPDGVELVPTPAPADSRVQVDDEVTDARRFPTAGSVHVGEVAAGDDVASRGVLPNDSTADDRSAAGGSAAVDDPDDRSPAPVVDRAVLAELVADGAGRRRVARVLGTTEYRAAALLAQARSAPRETPGEPRSTAGGGSDLALNGTVNGMVRS